MEVKEIKKKLKKSLDKQRYQHTLGVMYTAGCLAMANGYSIEKAMLAGLLHDCAKCLSTEKKIELCVKKNIDITEVEISNPGLLHAKAGMVLAEEEYGIKDTQILHAIRVHTTGEADMGLLDKILFVADYIEPRRYKAADLPRMRKLAFEDLDRACLAIMESILRYLGTLDCPIDPLTIAACNHMRAVAARSREQAAAGNGEIGPEKIKEENTVESVKRNGKTRSRSAGREKGRRYKNY